MEITGFKDLEMQLSKIGDLDFAKEVAEAGAKPLADAIRKSIENLPEDEFRFLQPGEKFDGVPKNQKKDLLDSLGVSPADVDHGGNTNIKVGFDGYGTYKTARYPQGLPNALLMRAIESGSSVRKKRPTIRPTVNKVRSETTEAMQLKYDERIHSIKK